MGSQSSVSQVAPSPRSRRSGRSKVKLGIALGSLLLAVACVGYIVHEVLIVTQPTLQAATTERVSRDLRFIKHSNRGWVRADAPSLGDLTTCEIAGHTFRCLREERSQYESELAQIGKELSLVP